MEIRRKIGWAIFVGVSMFSAACLSPASVVAKALPQRAKADANASKPITGVSVAQSYDVLEKIGAANEQLIQLSQEEGQLITSIPEHYQEANNVRNQIGQAIQSYGGHSSVSGNNQYECHLISPLLNGVIQRNQNAELRLEETKGQRRRLEIVDGAMELRISISNNEDYFLLFHDRREHGLIVQESDSEFMFNGKYTDFNEFCLRNTEYCQQRFFPLLKRFGIAFPETAYEHKVREIIVDLISGDGADAQQLLAQMGSEIMADEFSQRRATLKRMEDNYPANRLSLLRLILEPNQPAEIRHRFMEVLANKDKPLHQTMKNVILPQDLLNNVPFLVWALKIEEAPATLPDTTSTSTDSPIETGGDQANAVAAATEIDSENTDTQTADPAEAESAKDPVVRNPQVAIRLRERLAQLTQLPSDSSLQQWTETALGDVQTVATSTPVLPVDLFSSVDGLSVVEGKVGSVLRLVSDGKTLQFDREHWQEAFLHKAPRDHFREIQQLMQDRALPTQWLTEPTEFNLDEDVQALILAERLRSDIKERPENPNHRHYNMHEPKTTSNTCRIDGETVLIVLDMGASPVRMATAPCRLAFTEHGHQRRVIRFVERPESDFSLSVRSEESGDYFRLMVKHNGETSVRRFSGNATLEQNSPSFSQFQNEHPEIVEQLIQPLLKVLGGELHVREN